MGGENGLVDCEPGRLKFEHIVAKCQRVTSIAIGGAEKGLVNANAVVVRLVGADCAAGGDQAVGIAYGYERQRCLLEQTGLKLLSC